MKKIVSVFLSVVMMATMLCSTGQAVFADDVANISITVTTAAPFAAGNVVLPIKVENNGGSAITVNSITISGYSFGGRTLTATKQILEGSKANITAGTNFAVFPIQTVYNGDKDTTLNISIVYDTNKTYSTNVVVSATPTPEPPKPETPPPAKPVDLYISSLTSQIVKPGASSPFNFMVGNNGNGGVKKIRVKISGGSGGGSTGGGATTKETGAMTTDTSGDTFTLDSPTGWDEVNLNSSKTRYLRVAPGTKDGAYQISFNFEYLDDDDKKLTETETATIYVQSDNTNRPYVKSTHFDKKQIGKDNKAKMVATFVNPTGYNATNVRLSLNTELSKGFSLYENFQPITLPTSEPGSSYDFVFSTYLDSATVTGNYPMVFNISYEDASGAVVSIQDAIYTQVTRTPEADKEATDNKSKPRIIVANYKIDTEQIKAGQTFNLEFTLQNTSATASVKNVKVVVDSESTTTGGGTAGGNAAGGAAFFPAEGSNSFYIASLGTKKTITNKIKLMARQDVEPGVYPVVLRLEYDSDNQTQIQSEEKISFPVSQEQRLEVMGFTPPTDGMMGQPLTMNFQYINKGKSIIANFSIGVDGDFTIDGGGYIGNLAAGANDYAECTIIPNKAGSQKGAIVLSYEDSAAKKQEKRLEFTVNIMEMDPSMMGDGSGSGLPSAIPEGMMVDPVTGEFVPIKKKLPVVPLVVAGVIVVAIGGVITLTIIKKKRKAKKELMQDEED